MGKYDEWTRGQDEALLNRIGGIEGAKGILSGKLIVVPAEAKSAADLYTVSVNYDQSLAEMIAAGHYDWKNSDITVKNFPIMEYGAAEVAIQLIHFNKYMNSESVLSELDKLGLRPATLPELLTFGAAYPEIQRHFPIVALGLVWPYRHDGRNPYLWIRAGGRILDLDWFGGVWYGYYRFAAVSK